MKCLFRLSKPNQNVLYYTILGCVPGYGERGCREAFGWDGCGSTRLVSETRHTIGSMIVTELTEQDKTGLLDYLTWKSEQMTKFFRKLQHRRLQFFVVGGRGGPGIDSTCLF